MLGLSLLVYGEAAWDGELCYDDHKAITENPDVAGQQRPWGDLFLHDFWGADMSLDSSHKSYRPLAVASLRLDALLSASLSLPLPRVIRIHNAIAHALVSLLLTRWLLSLVSLLPSHLLPSSPSLLRSRCVSAALLFLAHPANVEAVAPAVARADLYATLFALLASLVAPLPLARQGSQLRACLVDLLRAAMAAGLLSCAVLFKEIAFFAFFFIVARDAVFLLFGVIRDRGLYAPLREIACDLFSRSKPSWPRWGVLLACAGGYLALRRVLSPALVLSNYRNAENPLAFMEVPWQRRLSMVYVLSYYFRLMLLPWPLSCDYSFDCIPLVRSWSDPRLLFPVFLVLSCCFLIRRAVLQQRAVAVVALAFVVMSMLAFSNLFFWVGTLVAERLLYLPLAGMLLLALAMMPPVVRPPWHHLWMLLLLVFVLFARSRAGDWKNEEILFSSAERVCASSVKVQHNLGILEMRRNDFPAAIRHLERAMIIDPSYCDPNFSLGKALLQTGMMQDSVERLVLALDCKWTRVQSLELLEALSKSWIQRDPSATAGHVLRARTLGRLAAAQELSEVERSGFALHAAAEWRDAGSKHYQKGPAGFEEALQCFSSALEVLQKGSVEQMEAGACTIQVYYWIGHLLTEGGHWEAARPYLEKTVTACDASLPSWNAARRLLDLQNQAHRQ